MPDDTRTQHFAYLNQEPRTEIGWRWEINEAVYEYFADLMRPLGWTPNSFYMSEFDHDDVTEKYTREGFVERVNG